MAQVGNIPMADIFFILFAVVFFISRLVVYPRYLLWTALYADRGRSSGPRPSIDRNRMQH